MNSTATDTLTAAQNWVRQTACPTCDLQNWLCANDHPNRAPRSTTRAQAQARVTAQSTPRPATALANVELAIDHYRQCCTDTAAADAVAEIVSMEELYTLWAEDGAALLPYVTPESGGDITAESVADWAAARDRCRRFLGGNVRHPEAACQRCGRTYYYCQGH